MVHYFYQKYIYMGKQIFLQLLLSCFLLSVEAQTSFPVVLVASSSYQNEPTICLNPKNLNQLVGGNNNDKYFYSNDAGVTWNTGTLTCPWGVWGDPGVVVDTNSHFYFTHLSYPPGYWIDRIVCQRSTNGQTWPYDSSSYMGLNHPKQQDKPWAVVDRRNNNLYVTWTQFDTYGTSNPADSSIILFSKSTDGGRTWSNAVRISRRAGDCQDSGNTDEGAVPAVGPNGEIYVSWAGPLGLMFNRSLDQGQTWVNANIFVSSIPGGWDFAIPGINRANGLPVTCCDLSSDAYHGSIYINWADQRNGASDTDIWFVKSTDGGNTWSTAKRVNDDPPGKQQFFTWMTVDQVTGYIYIVFYDRRNYPDTQTDVYLAVSKTGGNTFEPNIRISSAPFIPNNCPTAGNFFGDYTNISAYNNIVRPIWAMCNTSQQAVYISLIDSLYASTITWVGGNSSDWNNPWNWNPHSIPNNTQNIIVPHVLTNHFYPNVNANGLACNNLTVNSNASITISASITFTVNGLLTLQNPSTMTNNGIIVLKNNLINNNTP
jgi:hypothetical protein